MPYSVKLMSGPNKILIFRKPWESRGVEGSRSPHPGERGLRFQPWSRHLSFFWFEFMLHVTKLFNIPEFVNSIFITVNTLCCIYWINYNMLDFILPVGDNPPLSNSQTA